ncbi:MAG: c-type cytochrome [bacterium]|nr:c-type cytochrome [bacterium]MBK9305416.1 c-type cytochrome [bacterium]
MSRYRKWVLVVTVTVVAAGGVLLVVAALHLVSRGVSAREEPTMAECRAAGMMRRLAMPSAARNLVNPVPADEATLAEARAHFADHCALCHGNDGRGQTPIGRNLYPKAPDMTLAQTQHLTDGELFYIITNGIRLTGMPAWGSRTPQDDEATWGLVLLIRRLGQLSPEQIQQMKGMNPMSRAQFEEEEQERLWLEGGSNQNASGDLPPR